MNIEGQKKIFNAAGAICGGDQPIDACETTLAMLSDTVDYLKSHQPRPHELDEGTVWTTYTWLSKRCGSCAQVCEVSGETFNGEPTKQLRLYFTDPRSL